MVVFMHNNYVYDIDGSLTRVSGDDTYFETNNYKPVELTEEWLLKFGFNYSFDKIFSILINDYSALEYDLNNKSIEIISKGFRSYLYRKCEYVHELQNLYFALTGSELEIKK